MRNKVPEGDPCGWTAASVRAQFPTSSQYNSFLHRITLGCVTDPPQRQRTNWNVLTGSVPRQGPQQLLQKQLHLHLAPEMEACAMMVPPQKLLGSAAMGYF